MISLNGKVWPHVGLCVTVLLWHPLDCSAFFYQHYFFETGVFFLMGSIHNEKLLKMPISRLNLHKNHFLPFFTIYPHFSPFCPYHPRPAFIDVSERFDSNQKNRGKMCVNNFRQVKILAYSFNLKFQKIDVAQTLLKGQDK